MGFGVDNDACTVIGEGFGTTVVVGRVLVEVCSVVVVVCSLVLVVVVVK